MQGASAIQTALRERAGAPLRVFVVWEPVLVTDWATPTSGVLARLSDPRAAQFWDEGRLLSQKIQETLAANPNHELARGYGPQKVVWDVVAVYPKGVRWEGQFPMPAFGGGVVAQVMDEFRRHLATALGQ